MALRSKTDEPAAGADSKYGGMMKRIGTFLFIAGLASFVLPLFGLQLKIFNAFGENQAMAGVGAIVLGVVLLVAGSKSAATA